MVCPVAGYAAIADSGTSLSMDCGSPGRVLLKNLRCENLQVPTASTAMTSDSETEHGCGLSCHRVPIRRRPFQSSFGFSGLTYGFGFLSPMSQSHTHTAETLRPLGMRNCLGQMRAGILQWNLGEGVGRCFRAVVLPGFSLQRTHLRFTGVGVV